MKEQKLQTVKNYATSKGFTTTWVYALIKQGKLTCEIIDGVKFIVL